MQIKYWHDWHYWLRGGVIGLAFCLVYIFFDYIVVPRAFYIVCDTGFCVMPWVKFVESVFTMSILPLLSSWIGLILLESQTTYLIAVCVYYFFIGMIIGLVIGKIMKGLRAL